MAKDPTWKFGWKPSDVVCIIILFALIYAVAIWSGIMEKKDQAGKKHKKSGIDFFLGGRHMGWILIGVSIAASNIGTDVLVALTGSVASAGLGGMAYEIGSGWSILCLGWFMGPMYLRSLIKTIPHFMEDRYSKWCRIIFVLFSVAIFILSKMGVNVYAGSLIFQTMIGNITLWAFIPIMVVITALYTFVGGLTSVMWADLIQIAIFMISGLASVGFCLKFYDHKLGNLMKRLDELGQDHLQHLVLPSNNPDYPWPATTIGMLVHEYYYWSADQEMAQRVISAKGLGDARMGCALGSILKVACFFLSVVPGWTARAFYEECKLGNGHSNWCGPNALVGDFDMSDGEAANRAYPLLVMREFPQGFKGIMVAGFIAAVMSNLSGAINSLSTILTYDIYARFFKPKSGSSHSQRRLVLIGRVTVCVCAGITLVWQVGIQRLSINLFALTLAIQQHFGASIGSTLLIGSVWRRSNKWGGLGGLLCGGCFAIIHVALFLHEYNTCQSFISEDKLHVEYPHRYYYFACMHYTIFCCLIWGVTIGSNIIVSMSTPKPKPEDVEIYCVHWEDLIPRWVAWINPKFKKQELDYGYIDLIRREAQEAQRSVDMEVAEENKRRATKPTNPQTGDQQKQVKNKWMILGKKNKKEEVPPQDQTTQQNQLESGQNDVPGNGQEKELVDPLLDDKYLQKAQQDQKWKMEAAEFMGIGAFFFALFMFCYFR